MTNKEKKGSLEKMYNWGLRNLPNRNDLSDEDQKEIAHRVNKIRHYGFSFFPGIYIFDDVKYICNIAETHKSKGN